MTSLFISYSRRDTEIARKLTEAFEGQELDFWIDWESIPPTVEWWDEIKRGIEQANIFLFLLSPDSALSKVCAQEIDHAMKNGKRLIPVVVRDVKPDDAPAELRLLNWIFLRADDNFDIGFGKLITAIRTDYEWVEAHKNLQVKALEWERINKENSFLLRGKELEEAEFQLATNSSKDPHPTDLQREYVFSSRKTTDRERRLIISIAITGIIALAALAVFGFVQARLATQNASKAQANEISANKQAATAQAASTLAIANEAKAVANQKLADERAILARSGELAAQSTALRDRNFPVSLLLGIEAFNTQETAQTFGALMDNAYFNPALLAYLSGHTARVNCVVFSPDGKILASASDDKTVILWDVETMKPIGQLKKHPGPVNSVVFSPDGKILASASNGGTVLLWDVGTRQSIGQLSNQDSSTVLSLAFNPSGNILASGDDGHRIRLWDVETNKPIGDPLIGTSGSILALSFSPDGNILASGSGDYSIQLWDMKTRQIIGQRLSNESTGGGIWGIAFSPDGKKLISGSGFGNIGLWDVKTEKFLGQMEGYNSGGVKSVALSPDGTMVASGSLDHNIVLWDVETRQVIGQPLKGQPSIVNSVAFSPDGNMLASGSDDNTIILWDVATSLNKNRDKPDSISHPLTDHSYVVNGVTFSPDGNLLASSSDDYTIILWDALSRQPIWQSGNSYGCVAFNPDGNILASCSWRNIELLNVETGQRVLGIDNLDTLVESLAFSPDGKTLAAANWDNTVTLWDIRTGQPKGQQLKGHTDRVHSVAFSPDGKILASGSGDHTIRLWNVETGQPLGRPLLGHTDQVYSVAFSPDGKTLASGSMDFTIILWDVATGQPIGQPLKEHTEGVYSVAFSPDGKILASAGRDFTIILWDVETRQPIGQLNGHTGIVNRIAFSPDGKTLASGSNDNKIILWDVDPLSWIQRACQRVGRNFTRTEWERYFPGEQYRSICPEWPAGK